MTLTLKTEQTEYAIIIEPGCTRAADKYLHLNRKALIVTDSGVPRAYAERIAAFCAEPTIFCVEQGEGSKSIAVWERLLRAMLTHGFTRADCVIAVGGGVVGDLAGFAAACYMRGIDFYNIPTTVLSQVDSSVGGKTAVNLDGTKNPIGAFYQPKAVLIDTDLLATLPRRQVANGLAEAVKMALTSDAALFSLMETEEIDSILPTVIERSIRIKKQVVEADEKEQGLRRILNFGHTIGHGIESSAGLTGLYHGECVALGMLPFCAAGVRARLLPVLKKIGLPTACTIDPARVWDAMLHDKKKNGDSITVIEVETIGTCRAVKTDPAALRKRLDYYQSKEQNA